MNINSQIHNGNSLNGNGHNNNHRKSIKKRRRRKNISHEEMQTYNQEKRKENRKIKRKYLWEYKLKHPCKICGETHPICLSFHHKDRSKKECDVSSLINRGWKKLKDEIAKCDVVCDNCHKKLHYEELNGR